MTYSILGASKRRCFSGEQATGYKRRRFGFRQYIRLLRLGAWCFSGAWSLGFGICGLIFIASAIPRSIRAQPLTSISTNASARYETRSEHDPNGIGKFYMGREIAHVMGHDGGGAEWL